MQRVEYAQHAELKRQKRPRSDWWLISRILHSLVHGSRAAAGVEANPELGVIDQSNWRGNLGKGSLGLELMSSRGEDLNACSMSASPCS